MSVIDHGIRSNAITYHQLLFVRFTPAAAFARRVSLPVNAGRSREDVGDMVSGTWTRRLPFAAERL